MKKIHLLGLILLALLIIFSFTQIDYSNLALIHLSDLLNITKAMLQPDWAYVYDGSNEDLISLLLETLAIAIYGTVIGAVLALPFALLGSTTILGKRWTWLALMIKGFFGFLRSIPALIYGILFVRIVGPGPFAGALALGLQLIGMLGKLIAEALDAIDRQPLEAIAASGGSSYQVFQYAILPQVVPISASYILNHLEINMRSATVLGLVGAGGIGAPIIFALQQRNWAKVSIILIGIILIVIAIDFINSFIRKKLQ